MTGWNDPVQVAPSSSGVWDRRWNGTHALKRDKSPEGQWTFLHPITPVYKRKRWCHPLHTWGTMVAGRKQQVARGVRGREGLLRGLKKLSVLFTMDTMFWPLRLQHNNTCGFKFLPPPYSLPPSFNSVPAPLSCIIWLQLKDMNFPSIETSL